MWNHSINVVAYLCFCLCVLTPLLLQRYSVDFSSRADEANIPLSPVEPNFPGDRVSVNGQFNTTTVLKIILIIKRLCLSWFKDILLFFLFGHFSGLQTFESADAVTKQAQDPEAKPEVEEEQKGENKSVSHFHIWTSLFDFEKQNRSWSKWK